MLLRFLLQSLLPCCVAKSRDECSSSPRFALASQEKRLKQTKLAPACILNPFLFKPIATARSIRS
jgi:hypothetical protein